MPVVLVTDRIQPWFDLPDTTALTARGFLAQPDVAHGPDVQVLNLCRTGRYQGRGYYVSLLAEARGQRPLPDVKTVEDLKSDAHVRAIAAQVEPLLEGTLPREGSERFEIDAYLGKDPAGQNDVVAEKMFAMARAPLLRAVFTLRDGRWQLHAIDAVGLADVPSQHRAFLLDAVKAFITQAPRPTRSAPATPRIAILWDPDEPHKPSNEEALQRLVKAAPLVGLEAELVTPDALDRLETFDALFNRASPEVNGVTYEFVRRAQALGMPVVDDPESILRCLNKVYMYELMNRHGIAQPRTLVVHRDNVGQVAGTLGLPCVLKLPDSGFGLDVVKIESEEALQHEAERFFKVSELIIAQEWLPTGFDWRVGVYDRRPLFVAKYFMAPGHWKIINMDEGDAPVEGKTVAMAIGEAPERVIDTAVRAANLVGRGLYGVDLKQVEDRVYLIEVNCNPNLDAGNEDQVLGEALYREILGVFARRIAEHRHGTAQPAAQPGSQPGADSA